MRLPPQQFRRGYPGHSYAAPSAGTQIAAPSTPPVAEKRSFFLAADQWTVAFLVSVNPFHARHVREIYIRFRLSVLAMGRLGNLFRWFGKQYGQLSPGRTDLPPPYPQRRPAHIRPACSAAVRCPAPPRPWYVQVVDSTGILKNKMHDGCPTGNTKRISQR